MAMTGAVLPDDTDLVDAECTAQLGEVFRQDRNWTFQHLLVIEFQCVVADKAAVLRLVLG